jgi:3-oxoacyl-[acyl-carrier-protein] synthase II
VRADERRVVFTVVGLVSAAGCSVERAWRRLLDGHSAVRRITRFDVTRYPSQIAAEVDDAELEAAAAPARAASDGRIMRYAAAAAASAVEDARLECRRLDPQRAGVAIAAGMGRYEHREIFAACAAANASGADMFDWRALSSVLLREQQPDAADRRTPGSIPAAIAKEYRFGGPSMAVMTACAGGTQAIGDAVRWIRSGRADVAIAGAADSELYPMGLASFCLLGALSTRNDRPDAASRPFDAGRDGFVMGEGAGMLVLEEREHALARGARIYAEAAGFGSACDAYRATDPHPEGAGAVLAMRRALADAAAAAADVDYINAHGTSTVANDRAETAAIRNVFGERAPEIPISSTKSMIGHATVAAGAIEAIVAALTLRDQIVHPTINYERVDPGCDLDYVPNVARRGRVNVALSNSFAFGGQAACLVLRGHEA